MTKFDDDHDFHYNDGNVNEFNYICDYVHFVDYGCGGVVIIIGIVTMALVTSM